MNRKKQKYAALLAGVLVLAGVSWGAVHARKSISRKAVEVYPVSAAGYMFESDESQIMGEVTDSASQKVKKAGGLVDSVLVETGTRVKKGDVLLKYNKESVSLAVEADQASAALIKAKMESAGEEIVRLQSLRPAEEMPEPYEQVIHHSADPVDTLSRVDADTAPSAEGNVFFCSMDTVVSAGMLKKLDDTDRTAEFVLYIDNAEQGRWLVDGSAMDSGEKTVYITRETYKEKEGDSSPGETPGEEKPEETGENAEDPAGSEEEKPAGGERDTGNHISSETPSGEVPGEPAQEGIRETRREEQSPYQDWVPGEGIEFGGDGTVSVDYSRRHYGKLITVIPEETEWDEVVTVDPGSETAGDDYAFTRKELADSIKEKQKELKDLELSLKEAELKLKEDQLVSADGTVKASMDGIVAEVKKPEAVKEGDELLTVKGDSGFTVTAWFSEYDIRNIQKGELLQVTSYETASFFTAEVTDISFEPGQSGFGMNGNLTWYPVTARAVDADVELARGEYCQIRRTEGTEDADRICLQQMFIRKDDGGSYCMIAGEDNRLKKVYIRTGKSQWGALEILSGVTAEDRIAFPYGKNVQEGSPVVDKDSWYE